MTTSSTNTTTDETTKMETIHLNLEQAEASHPRRLCKFQNHLISYGGDTGIITALPLLSDQKKAQIIHQLDNPIRALDISPDGSRVAIGSDEGDVDIYVYTKEDLQKCGNVHPFLSKLNKKSKHSNTDDDNEEEEEGLFTQSENILDNDDDDDDMDLLGDSSSSSSMNNLVVPLPQPFKAARFTTPIRQLTFDPRSSSKTYYLTITTEESPGFQVLNVHSATTCNTPEQKYLSEEAELAHCSGGVRSACYSPDGTILSTLGMDGRMCLWNVEDMDDPVINWEILYKDEGKVVKKVDVGELLGADVCDVSTSCAWSCNSGGDGNILALPGDAELKLRRKSNDDDEWFRKESIILSLGSKRSEIVTIVFDPKNEGFVITSDRDGTVGLWEIYPEPKAVTSDGESTEEGRFIANITQEKSMCTNAIWHQDPQTKEEVLYLALDNGTMRCIQGRDNITLLSKRKELEEDDTSDEQVDVPDEGRKRLRRKTSTTISQSDVNEDDEDDDDATVAFDEIDLPERSSNNGPNQFIMDEADEDDNKSENDVQFDDVLASAEIDTDVPDKQETPTQNNKDSNKENGSNGHDDNDNLDDDLEDDDFGEQFATTSTSLTLKQPEPQAAFAPSATPIAPRRILCWNHIGTISSRADGMINSIDISFQDSVSQRPITFKDNMDFILGTLGDEGGLFASDLEDDDDDENDADDDHSMDGLGVSEITKKTIKKSKRRMRGDVSSATGSCIYFHRFETFGPVKEKDWYLNLPSGERALGCACGSGWAAVVTSRRFLRTFSSGGVQGPMIWIKGDPVTLVGRGRFVAVIYHESSPLMDGTQKLGYSLVDGFTGAEIATGSVSAISSKSSLTWAGFSNDNSLCVMDDDGMLSMLVSMKPEGSMTNSSWVWIPMLDTVGLKKSSEDTLWPVQVQDGKLICVPLKGTSHPDPVRRPVTSSFSLRIPLAKCDSGKNVAMEEVCVRANIALQNKKCLDEIIMASEGDDCIEELETEHEAISKQVDKVTLKLFISFARAGKLERALDLARRLHLEETFDIAITVADRLNHHSLSDRVIAFKEKICSPPNEEEEDYESEDNFENNMHDEYHSNDDDDNEVTHEEEESQMDLRSVSPDTLKRKDRESEGQTIRQVKSRMMDEDDDDEKRNTMRRNPFAKARKVLSPNKAIAPSPPSKKPTLSRMSTISQIARKHMKCSKQII